LDQILRLNGRSEFALGSKRYAFALCFTQRFNKSVEVFTSTGFGQ